MSDSDTVLSVDQVFARLNAAEELYDRKKKEVNALQAALAKVKECSGAGAKEGSGAWVKMELNKTVKGSSETQISSLKKLLEFFEKSAACKKKLPSGDDQGGLASSLKVIEDLVDGVQATADIKNNSHLLASLADTVKAILSRVEANWRKWTESKSGLPLVLSEGAPKTLGCLLAKVSDSEVNVRNSRGSSHGSSYLRGSMSTPEDQVAAAAGWVCLGHDIDVLSKRLFAGKGPEGVADSMVRQFISQSTAVWAKQAVDEAVEAALKPPSLPIKNPFEYAAHSLVMSPGASHPLPPLPGPMPGVPADETPLGLAGICETLWVVWRRVFEEELETRVYGSISEYLHMGSPLPSGQPEFRLAKWFSAGIRDSLEQNVVAMVNGAMATFWLKYPTGSSVAGAELVERAIVLLTQVYEMMDRSSCLSYIALIDSNPNQTRVAAFGNICKSMTVVESVGRPMLEALDGMSEEDTSILWKKLLWDREQPFVLTYAKKYIAAVAIMSAHKGLDGPHLATLVKGMLNDGGQAKLEVLRPLQKWFEEGAGDVTIPSRHDKILEPFIPSILRSYAPAVVDVLAAPARKAAPRKSSNPAYI